VIVDDLVAAADWILAQGLMEHDRPSSRTPAHFRADGELGYPADLSVIRDRLQRILNTPDDAVFVAEADSAVIGWLHVFLRPLLESDLSAEIGGLVVSRAARRHGVGRRLVAAAETWAQAHGAKLLTVRCRTERVEGNRFYEALSFPYREGPERLAKAAAGPVSEWASPPSRRFDSGRSRGELM
jgi:GNAT superfamily N-acetyltransferase